MPKESPLTKGQLWGLDLLGRFLDAIQGGVLADFVKSDELERFLQESAGGPFGQNVPDGRPGSEFPAAGGGNPVDVLRGLLHGILSDLGRIDHPGSADPARGIVGDDVAVRTYDSPGRHEVFQSDGAGNVTHARYFTEGGETIGYQKETIIQDEDGRGFTFQTDFAGRDGVPHHADWHVNASGAHQPGEDGSDANGARNPLSNLEVVGPVSLKDQAKWADDLGANADALDPNTGKSGVKLDEYEQDRLARTVPAEEALDPNRGIDPLTQLDLDPSRLHHRSEKDDRVDPNTGVEPMPKGL